MERRYQIFISSTFEDLRTEREGILRALVGIECFPASMEGFGAASTTPWDIIKSTIDLCDYYLVITAGKYGSEHSGISYTEREYDYAMSAGIPCLAFIHANPGALPMKHSETDSKKIEKLKAFQSKLSDAHLLERWENIDDLKFKVVTSLTKEMRRNPRSGWVRATEAAETDLYKKIEDLRSENDDLRQQISLWSKQTPEYALEELDQTSLYVTFDETDFRVAASREFASKTLVGKTISVGGLSILDSLGHALYRGVLETDMRTLAAKVGRRWYNKQTEGMPDQQRKGPMWVDYLDRLQIELLMLLDSMQLLKADKISIGVRSITHWAFTDFGRRVYARYRLNIERE